MQRIAERVTVRCPPVVANNPERAVSQERIEEILEDCIAGALEARRESRVGLLARARLRSAVKWELREIGYEEKFAELTADKLIARILRDVPQGRDQGT